MSGGNFESFVAIGLPPRVGYPMLGAVARRPWSQLEVGVMRVALLVGSGNPAFGGVERHVIQLAAGLVMARHQACVVMGYPVPVDVAHGLPPSVDQIRVPVPDGRSFPSFAGAILRHVRAWRPTVLHSHLTYGLAAGAMLRGAVRAPLVHTEHFAVRRSRDDGLRGYVGAALRGRADALICVSRAVSAGCRVGGGRPCRHIIYNGTSVPHDQVRVHGARRLLYVGRLEPDKRVELAIEVARALRADGYILDVVGAGSLAGRLRESAADLVAAGIVRFHGWQSDVAPFFRGGGVLLQPAVEGLGYASLEAIAYGLSVVAPASSGAAEAIALSGSGLAVADGAPVRVWAAAVREVVARPPVANPLPEAFRVEHMLGATLSVYEGLCGEARRVPA